MVYSGNSPTFFESSVIKEIADKHHATPAQVVLSWGVQRGTIVIPKSENEQRLVDNLTVSPSESDLRVARLTDWAVHHGQLIHLPGDDMKAVNNLHRKPGMHSSLVAYHEPDKTVFGWTYDQLGWNMAVGGIVL